MAGLYTPPINPQGSASRAVAAYMPYYAPPTVPVGAMIRGSSPLPSNVMPSSASPSHGAMAVNHAPRTLGLRFLYSRGGRRIRQFIMQATGAVQSTAFQPYTAYTWDGAFNDAIFQAGYPGRNLGISEKVPTIPPIALGIARDQMLPRPHFTRTIFTRRGYGGAPSVPAKGVS